MSKHHRWGCALLVSLCAVSVASAGPVGPTHYRSFEDSPLRALALPAFHLEDFEDGLGNTPGLLLDSRYVNAPSGLTDSVDADDGAIDGDGRGGFSFGSDQGYGMTFELDIGALGTYPTHFGVVVTDIGYTTGGPPMIPGYGTISIEAFSPLVGSLGVVEAPFGDGQVTGQTLEDTFLGWEDPRGIYAVRIGITSLDWEIDHLQYGGVPAPGGATVFATLMLAVSWRRRR